MGSNINTSNNAMANLATSNSHILPLPSGANRLSYAIPMPYIPSPPRPGANKGKGGEGEQEHSSLDNDQDHEEDSRRSTEINIDMQADRSLSCQPACQC